MKYGMDRSVRLYFSISDISELSSIDVDTLIQWEEIFPLKPTRNRASKRVYRQVDLHKVLWISRRLSELAPIEEIVAELHHFSPSELKAALDQESTNSDSINSSPNLETPNKQELIKGLVSIYKLLEKAQQG